MRRLLALNAALQLLGVGWDLPCSFEWENDGVAPRDFFAGIALNLPPGPGHTYPLLHNLLIGLINLPTLLVSVLTAPSLTPDVVMRRVLDYPTMTAVHLTAKLLAVAMNTLALAALARVTARLFERRAALWATAFALANLSVAYYGRTTNLDGPYLFWMALAADRLLDAVERGEPRDYRWFGLLVAASIATKDQAYAAWVLPGAAFAIGLPLLRPAALAAGGMHRRRLVEAAVACLLGLAALGGALWNPPGFLHRLRTLTGNASQDWRNYEASLQGVGQNLGDIAASLQWEWWPRPVLALVVLGLFLTLRRGRLTRWLPAGLALSHLLFFTLVVARHGHRFVLPTGFWLATYAGVAAAWLTARWQRLTWAPLAAIWLFALAQTLTVQVAQWTDARRPLEAWLAALPADTTVVTAGPIVSQPRWGRDGLTHLRVTRLGPEAPTARNPLLTVAERQGDLDGLAATRPDVIVLPAPLLSEYTEVAPRPGDAEQRVVRARRASGGAAFFAEVAANRVNGYTVRRVANQWPRILESAHLLLPHVHSSVGEDMVVLVRDAANLPLPAHGEPL